MTAHVLNGAWIALLFAVSATILVAPAFGVVTELKGDQDDKMYSATESITLSGKVSGNDTLINLVIIPPERDPIRCSIVDFCGQTTKGSGNSITFPAIKISDVFREDGTYKFQASHGSGSNREPYELLVKYENSVATIVGALLEIREINRQTVRANDELTFDVRLTDNSHRDVEYNIKTMNVVPQPPPAAQISATGKFSWTPTESDVKSGVYKVTIIASASSQTVEKIVEIKVNPPREVSASGVTAVSVEQERYAPADMMTVKGQTNDVSSNTRLKLSISPSDGGDSTVTIHTNVDSANRFTFPAFVVSDAFPSNGSYKMKITTPSESYDPYTASVTRTNQLIEYVGVALDLRDIRKRHAIAGSEVSFTVSPTDRSFTELDYELTSSPPSGARINDNGVFTWIPSDSDLGSGLVAKDHTITISAKTKDGSKTTTEQVVINVRPAIDASGNEVATPAPGTTVPDEPVRVLTLKTDKSSYGRGDSIIFSGTTENVKSRVEGITITVTPTATSGTIGRPQVKSSFARDDNTFTASPFKVTDLFTRDGPYLIRAFAQGQTAETGIPLRMEFESGTARIVFEKVLKIDTIGHKSIVRGSALSFTASTTETFSGLVWSLGGATLEGATLSSSGAFRWTPSATLDTQSFTITITVTDGTQVDSQSVTIEVTEPAAASEPDPQPTRTEPTTQTPVTPEPVAAAPDPLAAKKQSFLRSLDGATPQSILERYENDVGYKTWFDTNFAGLDIREALDIGQETPQPTNVDPHPSFVSSMTQGDDPQIYIDNYNNDAAYKAWFDQYFPDLTIQEAAGFRAAAPTTTAPPTTPTTPSAPATPTPTTPPPTEYVQVDPDPRFVSSMTQGNDPQTYIDRYNTDAAYKAWFDAAFPDLTIQVAAGLDTGTAPPPMPDSEFVPFMTDGDDPQTYVDRYNTDAAYKAWFDAAFPNLTIQQATGYVAPSSISCPPGTEIKDSKCVTVTTKPVSSTGGCIIATATYGTEMAPQVQSLREVRDNVLLETESGTAFMGAFNDIYYTFSPTVADTAQQSPEIRTMLRTILAPMISSLSIMSLAEPGSESDVLALGSLIIILNVGLYIAAPVTAAMLIRSRV